MQTPDRRAGGLHPQPELDPLTMLTLEELKGMDDLSGSTLYRAEVKRIPRLSLEEQQPLFDAARQGSLEARNRIVLHCLESTLNLAARISTQRELRHADVIDLVGSAQVKMLEKFDKALETENPLRSLIRTAAFEMKMYGIYDDPMIQRPRHIKLDPTHPNTVSFENKPENGQALSESFPAPDIHLSSQEPVEYPSLHEAIAKLTPRRRTAIVRGFGLYDHAAESIREIAESEHLTYKSVDNARLAARRSLAKKLAPPFERRGGK